MPLIDHNALRRIAAAAERIAAALERLPAAVVAETETPAQPRTVHQADIEAALADAAAHDDL